MQGAHTLSSYSIAQAEVRLGLSRVQQAELKNSGSSREEDREAARLLGGTGSSHRKRTGPGEPDMQTPDTRAQNQQTEWPALAGRPMSSMAQLLGSVLSFTVEGSGVTSA